MFFLLDLSFLSISFWDIIDILVVGFLIYQVYKLLRGSVALNIFVGVLSLYALWWLVGILKMELLSKILSQFVSVGVIVIAIVFQQELRRFLLLLGNQALRGRLQLKSFKNEDKQDKSLEINALRQSILTLSEDKTGALIVLSDSSTMINFSESGVILDAKINKNLILSIFNKESPLHDGAIIIANHKIHTASSILPISDNTDLPQSAGLRHRAALGVSEATNVAAFIVSEESGEISVAYQGKLEMNLDEAQLDKMLGKYYV
jgi:diadenylate cyclase